MATMFRKCAWCGADMGTKPCEPENDGKTSHGICEVCLTATRQKYLEACALKAKMIRENGHE